MNLENTVKFFAPQSPSLNGTPRATSSDALTRTDVIASMGMCQKSAQFGLSVFMGRVGISAAECDKAVQMLTQFGMRCCDKVTAIRKLPSKVKLKVIATLSKFAYRNYCRSAAGKERCTYCHGTGMIYRVEPVVKHPGCGEKTSPKITEERVGCQCMKCGGKGIVSVACNDCRGRGEVIDRKESERQGVPVKGACKRCGGRGYTRLPTSKAYKAIKYYIPELTEKAWRYSYKPLYEKMIVECERQESIAEQQLKKITK